MYPRSTITLSRVAFDHNIAAINRITGHTGLALVVKGNGYGHGIVQVAQLGQKNQGVSWLCTVSVDEALLLRSKGITKPLLVLSFLDGSLEQALEKDVHLPVRSYEDAVMIAAAAERVGKTAQVHVKIDTGMTRLGVLPDEALTQLHKMKQLTHVELYGIFTHLSDTGHADHSYSKHQLALFDQVLADAEAAGISFKVAHAQSSSSLDLVAKRAYSFWRIGALAYGLWKSEEQQALLASKLTTGALQPVLEWRTTIIQVKEVPAGTFIGYKRSIKTVRPTRIAYAPIGYWDGYPYAAANNGVALLKGYAVPVLGIISMNITAFDVTDIETTVGDELLLMGAAPRIFPHELAKRAQLITNEATVRLNSSIERIVVEEQYVTASVNKQQGDFQEKSED